MGSRLIRAAAAVCVCVAASALLASGLAGCGGGTGDSPSQAAEAFLEALIAHDNPSSFALLSMKSQGAMGVTPMTWPGVMKANPIPTDATFTVNSESIQGDTAAVAITTAQGLDRQVALVREDGEWLVDYEIGEWYGLAPGY